MVDQLIVTTHGVTFTKFSSLVKWIMDGRTSCHVLQNIIVC